MSGPTRTTPARRHGDLVFGLIAAVMLGLSTATWAVGRGVPPQILPRTGSVTVSAVATVVIVVALVIGLRRARVARRVVVATGWALGAVTAWLLLGLITGTDLLMLFALMFTVMFTYCLLTRTPAPAGRS
ncbi:hypothetical protein [Pseudonocardia endophytica]|uniref:Uncharacterized protein n=1 Tax=Pseudonocardia endophytica TaxID=401976 RepID=A0A4R1HL55_PSEEN|nr:hypothetical protein [Pseudonocardia endophytica]TCK21821.1 hypothetical protein EV378_5812 [Pseudonocardia endophytica]